MALVIYVDGHQPALGLLPNYLPNSLPRKAHIATVDPRYLKALFQVLVNFDTSAQTRSFDRKINWAK